MAGYPSINGVRSSNMPSVKNQNSYANNMPSGLSTEKPVRVKTNNPPTSTPAPRGHA